VLKSHIAKIERVRGGFNMEMLEFELDYRWNIFKANQQPLTPIFPNVEISKNQTLPGSPQPDTGAPPTLPAGSPPPPTVPQSGPVGGIPISPPAANPDPVPVSRPGMTPKGVGPKPVIGGRKQMED
jgi:hypothetical protein